MIEMKETKTNSIIKQADDLKTGIQIDKLSGKVASTVYCTAGKYR
jgi:hypothetical protein